MGVETFIARQPIFDKDLDVYGYELLHRTGQIGFYDAEDHDQATVELINNSLLVNHLGDLTGGRLGFINITRNLLFHDFLDLLPRDQIVIELLETIRPEPAVVAAVRMLKANGHTIALDDFIYDPAYAPLVKLADIIKVDFLVTQGEERLQMLEHCKGDDKIFLAEKVETREDFEEAKEFGYSLFQGYFFCKPETTSKRDLPRCKVNYLDFLCEISRPTLRLERIEEIIKREMSLSAKLLRYLNSAYFGVKQEITSIRQALVHLGERPLKRWASLVALAGIGDDKPQELVITSLVRARFCEQLAMTAGLKGHELDHFLTGMFSTIDALVDRPLHDALTEIGLAPEIEQAIEGDSNSLLGKVYALAIACERADTESYTRLAAELGVSEQDVADVYAQALFWSDGVFQRGANSEAA